MRTVRTAAAKSRRLLPLLIPFVGRCRTQASHIRAALPGNWKLLAEHTEVESGKNEANRPALAKTLHDCKLRMATLVIAKLDRLSRDAHFLPGLEKAGVDFVAVDMPNANRLTVRLRR